VKQSGKKTLPASIAFRFVLILGIANLFADFTYEGARSSTGQFLGTLGASAAVVGFTAGLGELLGYALRSVSGVIADKTGKYWIITIVALAAQRFGRQRHSIYPPRLRRITSSSASARSTGTATPAPQLIHHPAADAKSNPRRCSNLLVSWRGDW
jgi:hypothetical protein